MKTSRQITSLAFVTACLVVALIVAGEQTYAAEFDLRNDWSDELNPNGVWALRGGDVVLKHIDATSIDPFSPEQGGWSGVPIPFWFKSTSQLFNYDWQPGDIVVHTQDDLSGRGNGPA